MLKNNYDMLVNKLRPLIGKYVTNTKIRNIISDEFHKRGLLSSKAINILSGKIKLEELTIDNEQHLFMLFIFTDAMFKALSSVDDVTQDTLGTLDEYSDLIVNNYFTTLEVSNFIDFVLEKQEVSRYPYTFPNMIQVGERHWMGITPSQYLAEIDASNDINYNYAIQRDPKINVFGFKEINIDDKKIRTIMTRMIKGKQKPDEIKLNVMKGSGEGDYQNFECKFFPYSKDGIVGDLVIYSGEIDIFDGYHRKTANSLAIKEFPELDFNWKIAITNWSEKDAQDYMVQINEQKPIKREHTRGMNTNIIGNLVVDRIKDGTSEFGTQIKDNDAELKFNGLTKKSILSLTIEECYKEYLGNRILINPLGDWIAEFMDYLMGLYMDEFIFNVKATKTTSYISNKNMFIGYIALSEKLYKNDNWKSILKEKMESIDFSINNPFWREIAYNSDEDLSKRTKKYLYNLFREGVLNDK
jgi:hypothetical protein